MISFETISRTASHIANFCCAVAQWRIPAATFIFLTVCNALFWYSVFYVQDIHKFTLLIGLCVTSFCISVLNPIFSEIKVRETLTGLKESRHEFQRLTAVQKVAYLIVNGFVLPFSALLLPALRILIIILTNRSFEFFIMLNSGVASALLYQKKNEQACWASYILLSFVLSAPPWRYNRVSEQINENFRKSWKIASNTIDRNILAPSRSGLHALYTILAYFLFGYWIPGLLASLHNAWTISLTFVRCKLVLPVQNFVLASKYVVEYVFLGYWLPPLKSYLNRKMDDFVAFVNRTIIWPVERFTIRTIDFFKYYLLGYWITPLIQRLKRQWLKFTIYVRITVIDPTVSKYLACKNFTIYWLGGYWIPPFVDYCRNFKRRMVAGVYVNLVRPICEFFANFTENMIYILTGRWIPGFVDLLYTTICLPVVNSIQTLLDLALYIIYGYWIQDLSNFAALKKSQLKIYVTDAIIERTRLRFLDMKENAKNLAIDSAIKIRMLVVNFAIKLTYKLLKLKDDLIAALITNAHGLKRHLINDYWIPAKSKSRRWSIKARLYLKYKILLPALKYALLGSIYAIEFLFASILTPLFGLAFQQLNRAFQIFMDKYGYDGWQWFVTQLPEKSPFVDDSDTELRDFLPNVDHSDSEDERVVKRISLRESDQSVNDSAFSSSDDEEFSRNLRIPAFEHADSDEEQEAAFQPELESLREKSFNGSRTPENFGDAADVRSDAVQRELSPQSITKTSSVYTNDILGHISNVVASTSSALPALPSGVKSVLTNAAFYALNKASDTAYYMWDSRNPQRRSDSAEFDPDETPDFEIVE